VLLHLVSAQEEDVGHVYETVRTELAAYGGGLDEKPEVLALSQVDTIDAETRMEKLAALKEASGKTPLVLSAATSEGTETVLRALMEVVLAARKAENPEVDDPRWQKDAT
jgi:GTP-binding protein